MITAVQPENSRTLFRFTTQNSLYERRRPSPNQSSNDGQVSRSSRSTHFVDYLNEHDADAGIKRMRRTISVKPIGSLLDPFQPVIPAKPIIEGSAAGDHCGIPHLVDKICRD